MTNKLKWLLLGPCLAALLVFAPSLAGTEAPAKKTAATQPPAEASVPSTRVAVSLCGVLVLAAATLLIWRRFGGKLPVGGRAAERQLRVHETLRLSPRSRVHLVSVSGSMLLLGEGDKGVELLHRVGGAAEPAVAPAIADFTDDDDDAEAAPAPGQRTDGAEPRDMILEPAPRRARQQASTVADFRKLLEKVRAEVAS